MTKLFVLFFFLCFSIYSQEKEESTKLEFSGSLRVRGFNLERDALLNRSTSTQPVYNKQSEANQQSTANQNAVNNDIATRSTGQPATLKPNKEKLNYFDTRVLLNLNFVSSRYIDGIWGIAVGDIPFGGRGISNTSNDPYLSGPGSGGELNQISAANVQTNFLYVNFKIPSENIAIRTGIQQFSSAQGRVLLANGAGALITKDIPKYSTTLEGGWILARDRTPPNPDSNGFRSTKNIKANILFAKVKLNIIRSMKNEIYTYFSDDDDNTDPEKETGHLFWHGLFNEVNLTKFSFVIHGILNEGKVRSQNPYRDALGNPVYYKNDIHSIKGTLFDVQFTYFYSDKISISLVGIGTTGRPGYEKDGVNASYRGGGYRTLAPGYSISNIAIDFTGGYALFNGKTMTGLIEYGSYANVLVYGPLQLTIGYYRLYANKSPHIESNRSFNADNWKSSSNYLGQEYNLNLRWNVFRDLQILFRSGLFIAADGLNALNDTNTGKYNALNNYPVYGRYIREAFFTVEQKF